MATSAAAASAAAGAMPDVSKLRESTPAAHETLNAPPEALAALIAASSTVTTWAWLSSTASVARSRLE